ncbi:LOW QUALITY PROTEIN: hypothetical protein HID58_094589, partial [Brassica napus]
GKKKTMGRLAIAAITSLWVIPMSTIVNHIVPDPYMDEIFHVPQAQQYCNGNFRSWDPMITTPPGLYYLSLAHVASLFPGMLLMRTTSQSFSEACSTSVLRSTNAVFAVLCGVLVYEIIRFLGPSLSDRKATLMALVMSLYPLHWFFTFLYYTDVASLTTFLAMYLACLRRRYILSAVFGTLAILIRQTNVVWMLFVACSGVLDFTLDSPRKMDKQKVNKDLHQSIDRKEATLRSNLRNRKPDNNLDTRDSFDRGKSVSSAEDTSGLVYDVYDVISTSWNMKWKICSNSALHRGCGSLWYFYTLERRYSAKEAHVVSPHFAQIMYFSLVSALFTAPLHFSVEQVRNLLQELRRNWPLSLLLTLVALVAGFASVHFFSLAHPYLLADNRHYPFYLWRKIINAHWLMKYMLVPVYVYSWFSILTLLAKTRSKIWVLVYFLATCAVLVPTPLIEFRYYHHSVLYLHASLLCQKQRLHNLASYWNDFCVYQYHSSGAMRMVSKGYLVGTKVYTLLLQLVTSRSLGNWRKIVGGVEWSELLKITQAATIRMGRKLREKVTCSPIQSHPGFMWGLFDILKHNHWRYIKKRLPHKRPLACTHCISVSKSKVEDETIVDSVKRPKKPSSSAVKSKESNSGEKPKKPEDKSKNLNSEEKRRKTHSEIKRSVKALIKALVIEDKSKKKGRHHRRSSTYPVQSNPKEKDSLSELVESSDKNSSNGDEHDWHLTRHWSLNPLYLMSEESSNSDSEDLIDDTDENKPDFDESDSKKRDDEEEAWLDPTLKHTENEDDDTSPRRARSRLSASQAFPEPTSFSSKTMTKAGSFPTHAIEKIITMVLTRLRNKSMSLPLLHNTEQTGFRLMKPWKNLLMKRIYLVLATRGREERTVVIKNVSGSKAEDKAWINENKNEKNTVSLWMLFEHDILKGSPANKAQGAKLKQIRRTSYLQLYESSVQRERRRIIILQKNWRLSLRSRRLGKDSSSPEMKSPYALKIEDLPGQLTTFSRSLKQEQDVLEDIQRSQKINLRDSPTFDEIASESLMPLDSDTEVFIEATIRKLPAAEIDQVLQVEAQDKGKFNYTFSRSLVSNAPEIALMWQSDTSHPLVYEEVTTNNRLYDPRSGMFKKRRRRSVTDNHLFSRSNQRRGTNRNYERSYHYCPKPLSSLVESIQCQWGIGLSREDGWMDLQFESECVGIEVEDLIFEELPKSCLYRFK